MYALLADLRIVECASFIAAPSCALHLSQLGADVIRIDPIGGGPDFRRWPLAASGASFYWEGLNKGKRSVAVDFGRPEGRELVADLVAAGGAGGSGGLFVTNFPAEGFLSHAALASRRADLITLRVMGFADGGTAVDYTVNAAVGVPQMTGPVEQGEAPVNHVLPAWDLTTGAYAAMTLLAAERHRRATGQGQEIRLPLADMALASLGHIGQVAEVLHLGDRPRMGNELYGAFGRDFATADGQRVMLVAITPRQWSGLLEVLNLQGSVAEVEAARGVSFARDEGLRFTHRDALLPLVEQAVAARTLADLAPQFDARGVCWSAYRPLSHSLVHDPRLAATRPLFDAIEQPSGHRYAVPGAAAQFAGLARQPVRRAPHLGEHTDAVLADLLGLSGAQIGALHDRKVVAGPST